MISPILIFSYNRPLHLKRTLEALSNNDLASKSILYIYCDGAKTDATENQKMRVSENRKVAHSAKGFKELHIVEREKNVGLKVNIVNAVTEVINQYGRVITLEDDVVTSTGFLRYMNDALDLYADEENVMHISGYMWPHRGKLPDTFFYEVPYPGGGWATWARAWNHYNDDSGYLYDYWKNDWDCFNRFGGDYLQRQLEANYRGTMNTWFIKWHAVMLMHEGLTLYPHTSLTNNIGFDLEATNCCVTTKFDVDKLVERVNVKRIDLKENKKASRIIYDFYQGHWYNRRRRRQMISKVLSKLHISWR